MLNWRKDLKKKKTPAVSAIVTEYPKLITNERTYDYSELQEYISKEIESSKISIDCNQRVYINIIVEKDGTVCKIRNLRPTNNTKCEEEAIRIVRTMKQWTPGSVNGSIVRTQLLIPFWKEKN